jgi:hypothetical protein
MAAVGIRHSSEEPARAVENKFSLNRNLAGKSQFGINPRTNKAALVKESSKTESIRVLLYVTIFVL